MVNSSSQLIWGQLQESLKRETETTQTKTRSMGRNVDVTRKGCRGEYVCGDFDAFNEAVFG